jgi:hypothetical protein
MFTRMRRMGLLYQHDNPFGHVWLPNRSGNGKYKRHRWTGYLPSSFGEKPKGK